MRGMLYDDGYSGAALSRVDATQCNAMQCKKKKRYGGPGLVKKEMQTTGTFIYLALEFDVKERKMKKPFLLLLKKEKDFTLFFFFFFFFFSPNPFLLNSRFDQKAKRPSERKRGNCHDIVSYVRNIKNLCRCIWRLPSFDSPKRYGPQVHNPWLALKSLHHTSSMFNENKRSRDDEDGSLPMGKKVFCHFRPAGHPFLFLTDSAAEIVFNVITRRRPQYASRSQSFTSIPPYGYDTTS